ncbi:threonine-phosphate decarboxylase [uncultured Pseudoteredinibacter sp.]|uniref:threonine-phosphate decarboxylase n=1 Tax=uncultured Pseudoteredinibacter sp. TaxID=1641701 RepID=UPI00262796F7|nr:threonine-phosphate decarboxylase [uncultured Pseudoteredinibacter sp.]
MKITTSISHGGRLAEIAAASNTGIAQWLDLSTGISPWSWPVPQIPEAVWRELPNDNDQLEKIAQNFYQKNTAGLAIAGTQWLIQHLPVCLPETKTVALPERGYQEHHKAWLLSGNRYLLYKNQKDLMAKLEQKPEVNTVVLINPNNPSAETYSHKTCEDIAKLCEKRGGYLIVDEAFKDIETANIPPVDSANNIICTRSLGKFFGLAGIRLGFVFGPSKLTEQLRGMAEPWSVNGPARYIAKQCLQDHKWHNEQRQRIKAANQSLHQLLKQLKQQVSSGAEPAELLDGGLFITLKGDKGKIASLHNYLLSQAIYCRIFDPIENHNLLRFGLCDTGGLERLKMVIKTYIKQG